MIAALKPAGPAPMTRRSGVSDVNAGTPGQWRRFKQLVLRQLTYRRKAVEALATTHHRARAPLQSAEIARRERVSKRRNDFVLRDEFAEADDIAASRPLMVSRQMFGLS